MAPSVTISARGEQRVRLGHPWIYRADVAAVAADGGDVVQVLGPRARVLGYALFSDRSQIVPRMLTRGDSIADEALIRTRLQQAIAFRSGREVVKENGTGEPSPTSVTNSPRSTLPAKSIL